MGTEVKPVDSAASWMRQQERQMTQQQRRPAVYNASDLLGPGFGPTATQILDWNSEDATFTGFFWSPVGSINSPDGSEEWAGMTVSEDERAFGVQRIWSVRDGDPPLEYVRRFVNPGGNTTPTFTPWRGQLDWQIAGITALTGCTLLSQNWRKTGHVVAFAARIQLTATITVNANGDVANTPLLQVPDEVVPNSPLLSQSLSGTNSGPMTQWYIDPLGVVNIAATVPGASLASGVTLSVGGTYML